jgi:hypothetical protein
MIEPLDRLKPLEMVFPNHLKILSNIIMNSGVIESPLIADEKTGIILDGSHRYIFFRKYGYKEAVVKFINYYDENIRVGTHLMHRHIIDGSTNISKKEVIKRGLSGDLFPPRTTRHFFPFRKNTFANVSLNSLKKGKERNVSEYIADVSINEEISHNKKYIEEIDFEIDEIIRYLDEARLTKVYLRRQIETMNKSN